MTPLLYISQCSQQEIKAWEEVFGRFFSKYTKSELEEGAAQRGIRLCRACDVEDLIQNRVLEARGFWKDLEYPELKAKISHPAHYFLSNEIECKVRCRAPSIGEHNQEIYSEELGLSKDEIAALREAKVI